MAPRRDRWERIAALQRLLRKIERARLGALHAKDGDLKLRERNLVERLGSEEAFPFSGAVLAPALESAGRERSALKGRIADQSFAMRERERKTKQSERRAAAERQEADRRQEERRLREIVDWALREDKVSAR
jgi:hypothetical protein